MTPSVTLALKFATFKKAVREFGIANFHERYESVQKTVNSKWKLISNVLAVGNRLYGVIHGGPTRS